MAEAVKRGSYDPYRNVSYAYDGSAARVLDREENAVSRPRVRSRRQELTRPKVEPRPAGAVSPFAVVGFASVAVMAVMILMCCVTLSSVSGELVKLEKQMSQLKTEEATLLARYELAYDLGAIEDAVTADGSMSRPQAGQTVYVDLTEPDRVVMYETQTESTGGMLEGLEEAAANIVAYFRGEGE